MYNERAGGGLESELGKYRLIAELARGGMGIVYLAAVQGPAGFSKLFAIKELKPDLVRDDEFLAMFLNEARLAARLHHPNIVQTLEVDCVDGRHFIAMEYLDGVTLRRALNRFAERGGMPLKMQLRIISEVLLGLHQAHELQDFDGKPLGLVHRDMNPHNVFLTFDGQAKILDFGIAKTLDSSQRTEAGTFKGKVAYMPPEQALADRPDRRADLYSVGVMLWEAVAGRRLWTEKQDVRVLMKVVQGDIPKLEEVKPNTPPGLLRIVSRAMAFKRDDRYATASEFHDDLERYIAATGHNVTMREIGAALSEAFTEERAKTKQAIDANLAKMRTGGNLSLRPLPMAPPASPSDPNPVSSADESGDLPIFTDEPASSAPDSSRRSETGAAVARGSDPELVVPSRSRLPLALGVGGAAIAIVALAVVLGSSKSEPAPTQATSSPSSAAASVAAQPVAQTAAPIAPSTIDVSLKVTPANATLTLDGEAVKGPSIVKTFPRGADVHRLRASAPGFVTRTQEFTAERDLVMDIGLVPLGAGAAPVAAQPPAHATASAQPTVTSPAATPTKGDLPSRPIDTASPYGGK